MIYAITFIHSMHLIPYTVLTNSEVLAKMFINQIGCCKTAIAIGPFNNMATSRETMDDREYGSALNGAPNRLKVVRSKIDPNIQILTTDILMDIYEDRVIPIIRKQCPNFDILRLLARSLRGEPMKTNMEKSLDMTITLLAIYVSIGKLDYVKLSTDLPFHVKYYGSLKHAME